MFSTSILVQSLHYAGLESISRNESSDHLHDDDAPRSAVPHYCYLQRDDGDEGLLADCGGGAARDSRPFLVANGYGDCADDVHDGGVVSAGHRYGRLLHPWLSD